MEIMIKLAWGLLAALHFAPALPIVNPRLVERLYGAPSTGEVGLLLVHRGALFAALFAAACFALVHTDSRRLVSVLMAVSMISFLFLYARAGAPAGPLRSIAMADAIGLIPLAVALWSAWGRIS